MLIAWQDGLDDHKELTPFLHAKLMEEMMRWVFENQPPDMAAAIKARADKAAKEAAAAHAALVKEEATNSGEVPPCPVNGSPFALQSADLPLS